MPAPGQARARFLGQLNRREWLRVGGLGAGGLVLPELLRANVRADGGDRFFGRAKACILCFMWGGQPHQDLYDLKPDAPVELRGEFRPISSRVPGTQLGEMIPQIAERADRFALVRSVTHPDSTHTVAMHYMMTGHRHRRPTTNPMNASDDFPCFGSVMKKLRPSDTELPSGISLNAPGLEIPLGHIFPGFFGGFLGSGYDPMFIIDDPSADEFQPLRPIEGVTTARLRRRASLLAQFDTFRRRHDSNALVQSANSFQARALSLVTSADAGRALDLTQEPQAVRDRFGKSPFGQGCLLARRLVEAGVKLVTVNWTRTYQPGIADLWDTHARQFPLLRERLCPTFDTGFSALLDDLQQRGLLDQTLVVVMGEFGRTPQINKKGGRDHWAGCHSVLLAGGGIRGGALHGASDRLAAWPTRNPVSPEDISATMYHALGVPIRTKLVDHTGQPYSLSTGNPLLELFG